MKRKCARALDNGQATLRPITSKIIRDMAGLLSLIDGPFGGSPFSNEGRGRHGLTVFGKAAPSGNSHSIFAFPFRALNSADWVPGHARAVILQFERCVCPEGRFQPLLLKPFSVKNLPLRHFPISISPFSVRGTPLVIRRPRSPDTVAGACLIISARAPICESLWCSTRASLAKKCRHCQTL